MGQIISWILFCIFIVNFLISNTHAQITIPFNQPTTYEVSSYIYYFFQFPVTFASNDEFIVVEVVQEGEFVNRLGSDAAVGTGTTSSFTWISGISHAQNGEHNIAFFPQTNVMHLIRIRPTTTMNVTLTVSRVFNNGDGFQFPYGRSIFVRVTNNVAFYGYFDVTSAQDVLLRSSLSSTSQRNLIKKGQLPNPDDYDGIFRNSPRLRVDGCRFSDHVGRWYIYVSTISSSLTYSILIDSEPSSPHETNVLPLMNGTMNSYQVSPTSPLYLSAPILPSTSTNIGTLILMTVTGDGVENITFLTSDDASCPTFSNNKFTFNGPYPFLFIMFPSNEATSWTIAAFSNQTISFNVSVVYGQPLHGSLMLTPGIQYYGMMPFNANFGGTFDMGYSEAFDIVFNSYNPSTVRWARDQYPRTSSLADLTMSSAQGNRTASVNFCTTSALPSSLWSFDIYTGFSVPNYHPFSLLVIPNVQSPVIILENSLNQTFERTADHPIIYGFVVTNPVIIEIIVTDESEGPNNMLIGIEFAGSDNCIKSISLMTYTVLYDSTIQKYRIITVLSSSGYLLAIDPREIERTYNVEIKSYNNGFNGLVVEDGVTYNVRVPRTTFMYFTLPVHGSNFTIDLTGNYGTARLRKNALPSSSSGNARTTTWPTSSLSYGSCGDTIFVPGQWYLSFYSSSVQSVTFTPRIQSLPPATQLSDGIQSQSISPFSSSILTYDVNWNQTIISSDVFVYVTFSSTSVSTSPLNIRVNQKCDSYDFYIPRVQSNTNTAVFYPSYRGDYYFFIHNPSQATIQYNVAVSTVKLIDMNYDTTYSGYTSSTQMIYMIDVDRPTLIVINGSSSISFSATKQGFSSKRPTRGVIEIGCRDTELGLWRINVNYYLALNYNITATKDGNCRDAQGSSINDEFDLSIIVVISVIAFTVFSTFLSILCMRRRKRAALSARNTSSVNNRLHVEINSRPKEVSSRRDDFKEKKKKEIKEQEMNNINSHPYVIPLPQTYQSSLSLNSTLQPYGFNDPGPSSAYISAPSAPPLGISSNIDNNDYTAPPSYTF